MPKKTRTIKIIIGWTAAVIILYFLVRQLHSNWNEVASGDWKVNWGYLTLSGLALFAAYIFLARAWMQIVAGFGISTSFAGAFRVMYLAQLGRYIPGKIWQMVGMVGLARQIGVSPAVSLASFALGQIYFLPAAFLLIPFLLGDPGKFENFKTVGDLFYFIAGVIVTLFLIVFFKPGGLRWLLNTILRKLGKETVEYTPSLTNRFSVLILYLFSWILMGISFRLFVHSVSPETPISYSFAAGTYIASYVLGYLSFIAPGGLGVREAVMAGILKTLIPFPAATLIALVNRFFITAAEAVMSLLALLTYRLEKKRLDPDNTGNQKPS